jgi:Ca2+-binding RTX toxin-like protein
VGDWSNDIIDLRGISVLGSLVVDTGGGNDRLVGTVGNDVLRGGSGHDVLVGGAGVDTLDGGDGNDLLLATQGSSSARELYIGGAGNDWMALALNDRSTLDLRGGSASGADGAMDTFTLVGTRGALAFAAYLLDFEVGKDRIDLSQLRDSGGNRLGMEDLVLSSSDGNTQIGFAAGVYAVGGGAVDVQLHLVGVAGVAASSFSFTTPSMSGGLATLDTAFAYL